MFYICGFVAGGLGVWGRSPQLKNPLRLCAKKICSGAVTGLMEAKQ